MQTFMVFVALAVHGRTIELAKLTRSIPSAGTLAFLDEMMPREASLKAKYPCQIRFLRDDDDGIFDDVPCVGDGSAAFRSSL